MSEPNIFVGLWKVIYFAPVSVYTEPKGILGTLFQLSQTGSVTWKIPGGIVPTPLFKSDIYKIVSGTSPSSEHIAKFGAFRGHVIECKIKVFDRFSEGITLNDNWCVLICIRSEDFNDEEPTEFPFSFLQALQDGYFSDLTLKANNNKEFSVHTCILKLVIPEMDWSNENNPFSELSEDVVSAILHFLYAHCLPEGLDEATINKIISAASEISGLEGLISLCQSHFKNVNLKKKILSKMSAIHTCASQLIEYFSNKHSANQSDSLVSDPAKLCFAIKNSIREAAVAASYFFVFCDMYKKHQNEFSKEDDKEIILHVKTGVPIFMKQLETFFQLFKSTLRRLLPSQRQELACYLVQEIETIFNTVLSILDKVKTVMKIILVESEVEEILTYHKKSESFENYTFNSLYRKEVRTLTKFIRRTAIFYVYLHQKREKIKFMNRRSKIISVVKDLEQFITGYLSCFVILMEEFTSKLEEKLEWSGFQFSFKVWISRVNEVIKVLLAHEKSLQNMWVYLCDLVQRDSFANNLMVLGLLVSSPDPAFDSEEIIQEENFLNKTPTYQMPKFLTTSSFCVSPPAHRNRLSERCSELLKSERETDMVFEIINTGDFDNVIEPTGEVSVELQTPSSPQYCTMAAHRVIVSARCDCFRRALLSGMQESISRKIQVYDTTPHIFALFLEYLYSGQLDCTSLSEDELFELLFLSDRYQLDSLKEFCERGLKPYLDVDSVLYFFSIADRSNASILKKACLQLIALHSELKRHEAFKKLPPGLQSELYNIITFNEPGSPQNENSSSSSNVKDIEDTNTGFRINGNMHSSSTEVLPVIQPSRLQAALKRLRETEKKLFLS